MRSFGQRPLAAAALALALVAPPAPAADAPDEAFEKRVRPVFAKHCAGCHSGAGGKVKSGLDLDTRAAVLAGASSGPVVVPGKAAESLLIQAVRPGGSPHMPPKGQLSDPEVAALEAWVNALPAPARTGAATGKDHWSFRPLTRPAVPRTPPETRTAIDRFVSAKLEEKGLSAAPPAAKPDLIRRAYYDLTGLPPSPEEVRAFVADDSPAAFEKVVDTLLASPAYGERWGRHWLDLVRYADSGGFHSDIDRPNAWRYRDYVITSFNDDKPYARFVREQLAGDEVAPDDPGALAATGFGRHGPSNEDNMGKGTDREKYRLDELDGTVSTTGSAFLGLTVGCARCHDHKYDPIPQKDYYRLLAVFNTTVRKELPLPGAPEPKADDKGKKPAGPGIMALVDSGPTPRPTRLLWRGDVNNPGPEVTPGVPSALVSADVPFPSPPKGAKTTGRRTVLADWIASTDNPLTWRVLANRVWQHHFGRGLVATPGNFGRSGSPPTHPELLDHLASELVANGGRLKPLHKAIMLSAAYRQSSRSDPAAAKVDPENTLLWRQNKRRLEAEAVRDGILAVAGTLNAKAGGPGVKPRIRPDLLPASQRNKWPVVEREGPEHWRRSVYVYVKRQLLFPLLELFDAPTTTDVCDRRTESVVPTQALVLMNDEFVQDQADRFAERVAKDAGPKPAARAERALWLSLSRPPAAGRIADAVTFLEQQTAAHREAGLTAAAADAAALADLCHVLFNCNEFVYLD